MENQKPQWTMTEHSVLAIATEMHNHFRDLQSYYKIAKGRLVSQLEVATDKTEETAIKEQLLEIEEKITFFHILNNSISSVDTVLHTSKMITEFKKISQK